MFPNGILPSQVALVVKNLPASARDPDLISWVGKIPWRNKWQPTPVFLPGKSCGQRSLVGYSPRGHKELDTTEYTHTQWYSYYYISVQVQMQERVNIPVQKQSSRRKSPYLAAGQSFYSVQAFN